MYFSPTIYDYIISCCNMATLRNCQDLRFTYQCRSGFQSTHPCKGIRSRNFCFRKWPHLNNWSDRGRSLQLKENKLSLSLKRFFSYFFRNFTFNYNCEKFRKYVKPSKNNCITKQNELQQLINLSGANLILKAVERSFRVISFCFLT